MGKDENKSYLMQDQLSISFKNRNFRLLIENVSEYLPNFEIEAVLRLKNNTP